MTLVLIACLVATIVPVFFARLSAAPGWLALQALALAWIAWPETGAFGEHSAHALALFAEIVLVRVLLVPWLLRRVIHGSEQAHLALMPSNLFVWVIAVALIIFAFRFGDGARADERALTLGVVATTSVIALLILATNQHTKAQLIALLFMENALALFESLLPEPWPLPVHLAISTVYVATVAVGSRLIDDATPNETGEPR